MKAMLFATGLSLMLVSDSSAQRGGCTHSAAGAITSSVTPTSSSGTTGTTSVASDGGVSAIARQLGRLQMEQAYEQYLKEQEELTAQAEQERQEYLTERRERLLAQKGVTLSAKLGAGLGGPAGFVTYHTSKMNGVASTRLKIELTGAAPYSTHTISIGDREIGRITTDSRGVGLLIWSTSPRGSVQRDLPDNFPSSIVSGSSISVGSLTGTWRERTTI